MKRFVLPPVPALMMACACATLVFLPGIADENDDEDIRGPDVQVEPLPTMPPHARQTPSVPRMQEEDRPIPTAPRVEVDRAGLVADMAALRQDVVRVRSALEERDADFQSRIERESVQYQEPDADPGSQEVTPHGDPDISDRLGNNYLAVQRYRRGTTPMPPRVTARIHHERVEVVYRDLLFRLDKSPNDRGINPARRMVSLHVEDMPWEEALTRLLRQVGLGWRHEGERGGGRGASVIIFELSDTSQRPSDDRWQDAAMRSLRAAARSGNDAIAAEARYRMARNDQRQAERLRQEGRDDDTWRALHYAAISGFADVIQEFDTGTRVHGDILPWVRGSMLGIGSSMETVGMYREAYSVYRNFLARADREHEAVPQVMLAAANAARRQHARAATGDVSDLDIASRLLQDLINTYGDDPRVLATVTQARLELGQLYMQQGEYEAARTQLLAHADFAGDDISHRIHFMIAQAEMAMARRLRGQGEGYAREADVHFADAEARLEIITQSFFRRETDPLVDEDIYRRAMFKLGRVKMQRHRPDFVAALHIFLRARQRFPRSDLEAPLLISIARCYAEIHADREHIAHMWQLLENDELLDDRDVRFQLSEMLQDLQDQAEGYPGPIHARVLFYLAQYNYRVAEQNPSLHAEHYERAVALYQRVIDQRPPQHLAQASRLGLARAALAAGDDARGRSNLRDILRDPSTHPRDRALASQILGDHLHSEGRFREAIQAYDGNWDVRGGD
ncbi:MAG: hypothetical protein EA401_07175 [Planctomycetota bacterium]|nr:MAG: hypothetical protein EA401_07175 [Planctomycetota bacterium]